MEESSDEEGVPRTEGRDAEEDSEEIPLAEIARRQGQGEPGDEAGQGDEEETDESEIKQLGEAHKAVMAKKDAEERAENLKLAQKC